MAAAGEAPEALAAQLSQAAAPSRCLATVRQLTGLFREARHRENATEHVFQNLLHILREATSEVDVACGDVSALAHLDDSLLLLSECFRCLRNACVLCASNQNILRSLGLIEVSVRLIQLLQKLETDLESSLTAFRCSLQFLGNIATGNTDSQKRIWKLALPSLFLDCLHHQDEKIVDYCCMILFTCLNPERTLELQEENNLNIALAVLQAGRRYPESEWVFLIVTNHLLKCPELVKAMYARLSNQERTTLLELVLSEISDKNLAACKDLDTFLASCFQEKCQSVLRLASVSNNEDEDFCGIPVDVLQEVCYKNSAPKKGLIRSLYAKKTHTPNSAPRSSKVICRPGSESCTCETSVLSLVTHTALFRSPAKMQEALVTLQLLDALCEMTSNDGHLERLQACPDLLETAVRTLQLAHLSGKQATNVFTAAHSATAQEQISHPAMGFKSHLIRLIANLCHRNKANQDKVYELDGIPLILDNCSIDDNNPFISQWAVYAIHNLTEQNERNQELISQMEQQGLADSSFLDRTGLKVEKGDQKLVVRSIRKMPDL